MDDLNNDVTSEILLHLPIQSLLRFKSVCKSWYNIIDSSTFKKSHLHLHKNRDDDDDDDDDAMFIKYSARNKGYGKHYCVLEKKEKSYDMLGFHQLLNKNNNVSLQLLNKRDDLHVVGPVDGFICIYNQNIYFDFDTSCRSHTLSIAVYNPCLDKIKILPPSSCTSTLCLQYDLTRLIGFGFYNDYKIVELVFFGDIDEAPLVEVYSGTTNTWTKVPLTGDEFIGLYCRSFKTIMPSKKGSGSWANWKIQRYAGQYQGQYQILSFDMKNEVFETVSYPNFEGRKVNLKSSDVFVKDDDSFNLFVYTRDYERLELWELQSRKGGSWSHVTDIKTSLFHEEMKFKCFVPWAKALWKKHGVIFYSYSYEKHSFVFYDYSIHKVVGIKTCHNSDIEIFEYKGSLISP